MCTTYMQYPRWPEEGIRISQTGVTEVSRLPCGSLEFELGPLEEQPVSALNSLTIYSAPEHDFVSLSISMSVYPASCYQE